MKAKNVPAQFSSYSNNFDQINLFIFKATDFIFFNISRWTSELYVLC